MKQAFNTVKLATRDVALQREVINRAAELVQQADLHLTPAALSTPVYRIVSEVTGVSDPYQEVKTRTNEEALKLLPRMRRIIAAADDPLAAALHIAAAGNVIDLGIGQTWDLEEELDRAAGLRFARDDTAAFRKILGRGTKLLYLGDNSGEIVFDRALVETLLTRGVNVIFVVKSGPVINDVLLEDARLTGLADLVEIIESGSDDIGINYDAAGELFLKAWEKADVILAKGHGNFESLVGRDERIFFLLRAKCEVVAEALGVRPGDLVFGQDKNILSKEG